MPESMGCRQNDGSVYEYYDWPSFCKAFEILRRAGLLRPPARTKDDYTRGGVVLNILTALLSRRRRGQQCSARDIFILWCRGNGADPASVFYELNEYLAGRGIRRTIVQYLEDVASI